jgi:hypothetical protein
MNKSESKPDFIGIGAQRSGTSWLFNQLRGHPEFELPYMKEFHYFDRDRKYPSTNFLAEKYFFKRITIVAFRKRMIADFKRAIRNKDNERFNWFLNFYLPNVSDSWYLSQFSKMERLTGEYSPSYSILDIEDIYKMKNLMPDVKLVFLIRDPIERAWSSFRFNYSTNRIKKSLDYKDIINYIESPEQELRGNFLRTLHNYSNVFKSGQIVIGFYDAIIEQPHNLVNGITEFLGAKQRISETSNHLFLKKNTSPEMEIPEKVFDFLKDKYQSEISELSDIYKGYCIQWYLKYYGPPEKNKIQRNSALPPAFQII